MVVTVVEPLLVNAAAATYDIDLVREEVLPELRQFVGTTDAVRAPMRSPEYVVLVGEPAAEIVALAQRERAQLIAMATHGLSGYRKVLLVRPRPASSRFIDDRIRPRVGPRRLRGRVREGTPSRSGYRPDTRRPPGGSSCRGADEGFRTSAAAHRRPQSCSVRARRAKAPATHVHNPGVDRHRFRHSERIACGGNSQGGSCARCGLIVMGLRSGTLPGGATRVDRLSRTGTGTGADPCPSTGVVEVEWMKPDRIGRGHTAVAS
jgi:hypothetical protein